MGKGIGPVETQFFKFGSEADPFVCEDGGKLRLGQHSLMC